ncbi:Flavin containing amine oxidoreductase [Hyunsoonleella jejuensis]|uniref:Flavin containing amine oxidoreductase n=1 Tax=Hyunsoonleella jejuensis TaxID=419940 RepID=A0A1H8ZUG8_9FLAO|nr:NAD(P)/FAD-dependent oxidoreductase [Hyunsoonleella jejuensis]SEP68034.1 Flavin containing amine oxidoreductase [Hyunsoonleella jejuensis]
MDKNIVIVGAGISGLVAALQLEKYGYKPKILEADKRVGGRVQSDVVDGYTLDRGFQVLLSAYPLAKKYLDYNELQLESFVSGSYIFKKGKQFCIGDPLRDISLLWPTLFSSVGKFSDKIKVFKLNRLLNKKSIDAIFNDEALTTQKYLERFGFSDAIINDFFKPFFTGIFLETDLKTSSRMFEFIFKMFGEGEAVIPKYGIQEIPNQLLSKLKQTTVKYQQSVETVKENTIVLKDGSNITCDYCIVATEASSLIPNMTRHINSWKSTQTLYFEVDATMVFQKQIIGLLADAEDALINSISFPFSEHHTNKLLSVSVVKRHGLSEEELIKRIMEELNLYFSISTLRHLKTYTIEKALPDLANVSYSIDPSETQLTDSIYLVGDTLLNGSLNAAMLSGELAAKAIHQKITGYIE